MSATLNAPAVSNSGFCVYILWGADPDRPLYIGQTTNLRIRLRNHFADPERRALTTWVEVIKCESRAEMNETELILISDWQPTLNKRTHGLCSVVGCPYRVRWAGFCSLHVNMARGVDAKSR